MSSKNFAIGAVIVVVCVVMVILLAELSFTLQGINPIAAAVAVTVALIGIAWFKKTSKR